MFDTFNLQADIRLFEILKMCYPPKGLCGSRTRMVSIWYSFHFIVSREGSLILSIYKRKFACLKYWKNVLFTDGRDGKDGISKVNFNLFPYFVPIQIMNTCTYIYIIQIFQQNSYRFQKLMPSWGWGNIIFEITLCTWVFKYLVPNLSFFCRVSISILKIIRFFRKSQQPFFCLSKLKTYDIVRGTPTCC